MTKKCPNCGSEKLSINPTAINTSCAVDGRLKLNEIAIRFVVGCEECSETVSILNENQVTISYREK